MTELDGALASCWMYLWQGIDSDAYRTALGHGVRKATRYPVSTNQCNQVTRSQMTWRLHTVTNLNFPRHSGAGWGSQ